MSSRTAGTAPCAANVTNLMQAKPEQLKPRLCQISVSPRDTTHLRRHISTTKIDTIFWSAEGGLAKHSLRHDSAGAPVRTTRKKYGTTSATLTIVNAIWIKARANERKRTFRSDILKDLRPSLLVLSALHLISPDPSGPEPFTVFKQRKYAACRTKILGPAEAWRRLGWYPLDTPVSQPHRLSVNLTVTPLPLSVLGRAACSLYFGGWFASFVSLW